MVQSNAHCTKTLDTVYAYKTSKCYAANVNIFQKVHFSKQPLDVTPRAVDDATPKPNRTKTNHAREYARPRGIHRAIDAATRRTTTRRTTTTRTTTGPPPGGFCRRRANDGVRARHGSRGIDARDR